MRIRVYLVLTLVVLLLGCQAAPAATPTLGLTVEPSPTPLPTLSQAPTPSQTAVSTPTVSPAELIRRAGPVCENAFSALVESGPLITPFAVLKNARYADAPAWEISHSLPHVGSVSASEVGTIFCISEMRTQAGTYTDGSTAYQLFWEVRIISWPGGKVIGKNSFTGSSPETKVFSTGSVEGSFPYRDFAAWVFNQIKHPDFLFFNDAITSLAVSPDGNLAAFGTAMASQVVDRDYQAKIFLFHPVDLQTDLGTTAFIDALDGHQGMVTSLEFSPDGKILVSSGYDRFIKFWDVRGGGLLGQVVIPDTPTSLSFSADGSKLASASSLEVTLVNPLSMQIEQSIPVSSGDHLALSPDGNLIYLSTPFAITVIDSETGAVIIEFPDPSALVPTLTVAQDGSILGVTYETPNTVDNFALAPDGTQVTSYTVEPSLSSESGAGNVRLAAWDAKTGKYLSETNFAGDRIETMKLASDGRLLAVGNGNEVWLFDTTSWQIARKFSGHTDLIQDLEFDPDGKRILSASHDGTIRIWSVEE